MNFRITFLLPFVCFSSICFSANCFSTTASPAQRWIIELAGENLGQTVMSLEKKLQEVCPQIDIKTSLKMGLKNHYVVVLNSPLSDSTCLTKTSVIKRAEPDRMMRPTVMQPSIMPSKLNGG